MTIDQTKNFDIDEQVKFYLIYLKWYVRTLNRFSREKEERVVEIELFYGDFSAVATRITFSAACDCELYGIIFYRTRNTIVPISNFIVHYHL